MALTGVPGITFLVLSLCITVSAGAQRVGKPYGTDCPASSSFAPMCHPMYIFLFMTLFEATLNVSWLSK